MGRGAGDTEITRGGNRLPLATASVEDAALDALNTVRTSLSAADHPDESLGRALKSLRAVEDHVEVAAAGKPMPASATEDALLDLNTVRRLLLAADHPSAESLSRAVDSINAVEDYLTAVARLKQLADLSSAH